MKNENNKNKAKSLEDVEKEPSAQCTICNSFGIHRKIKDVYWECDNCGELGGIFIEPIKFVFIYNKEKVKRPSYKINNDN